jgi:hypothetical protein
MWDMFGLGLKQQAEGEISNLNDTRTELENWDLGDRFRSLVTGVSREETQKKAQELLDKKLNAATASSRGEITTLTGGFNLGLGNKIRPGETTEEYEARLAGEKTTATLANQYSLLDNADTSLLKPGMKAGDIRALSGKLTTSNKNEAEAKVTAERERQEGVTRGIEERARTERTNIRSSDLELQRENNNFNRELQRADNKLTRDLGILQSDNQMQIAQMNSDLADKRMDYDRETRRMDKRSAAIAQLMSGIGALGGAFAL